ncbi:MAG: hypothetical protein HC883_00020 [Bdellovibrionaceae bacterium]|nr:hypothetical protein [Pseudobdellovibrionaceae bacterium]
MAGRPPSTQELAEKLGVSREELWQLELKIQPIVVESIDGREDLWAKKEIRSLADPSPGPEAGLLREEHLDSVFWALAHLRPRVSRMVIRYFVDELQLKEIGAEEGIHESRASQVIRKALKDLRIILEKKRGEKTQMHSALKKPKPTLRAPLTGEEKNVAREVLNKAGLMQIALRLGLRKKDVQRHMRGVLEKTGTSSRVEFIAQWLPWRHDLLAEPLVTDEEARALQLPIAPAATEDPSPHTPSSQAAATKGQP